MSTVIISGVSRGIGLGLAERYLERGDTVVGTIRGRNKAIDALAKKYGQLFIIATVDVTDQSSVDTAAAKVGAKLESADLLICNAGVNHAQSGEITALADIADDELLEVFNVNVVGVLRTIRAFHPLLKAADEARIAVISSGAGSISQTSNGAMIPYCVSKAGLNMLSRRLHFLLADDDIGVFAISPGWVKTDMGGAGANITIEESSSLIVEQIDKHGPQGAPFLSHEGNSIAW